MYGSYHFFVLIKKFATAYERLVKAKMLIQEKVKEDIENDELFT